LPPAARSTSRYLSRDRKARRKRRTSAVVVNSDVAKEANETFFVNLSSPTGATIADGQGVGIIIDEDRSYVSDFDLDHVADFSVFRASKANGMSCSQHR
jgi:hypothetical protein